MVAPWPNVQSILVTNEVNKAGKHFLVARREDITGSFEPVRLSGMNQRRRTQ